ncbi:MAG: phosphate ABC transporter ATP-binding protein [Chloroflexi bacterium]|nr:phosphate ABC transporter ATP-binding protein [Chloroflexota bacterium]MYE41555.1 phosphate ABC transporter ATP-binding protein [Chloroflexota bacterium]
MVEATATGTIIRAEDLGVSYAGKPAVSDVTMDVPNHKITAIIGPSGCGKSTLLRSFNRMNDLVPTASVTGRVIFEGRNIYDPHVDPTEIRYLIGMVFQRPNPFPKSIYENVAFGPKINGFRGNMNELVERSLKAAALWDEVKDRLKSSALALSGGQQQRLCIARALAVEPSVILMDEPCSALDPIATLAIEQLMQELSQEYSIIIVTHNMQQAARVSHNTAFMLSDERNIGGFLVEYDESSRIFTNPKDERTEAYITGRFG